MWVSSWMAYDLTLRASYKFNFPISQKLMPSAFGQSIHSNLQQLKWSQSVAFVAAQSSQVQMWSGQTLESFT